MPKPKPLTKEMILAAMNKTKSNRAAARYLNVSYQHYKKWAKNFRTNDNDPNSLTLFESHKNQSGWQSHRFQRPQTAGCGWYYRTRYLIQPMWRLR